MQFRVDLSTYRGPLDLLLYLVRKHEVEVADIPVATITDQYLQYIEVLEELDVDDVGDFIEIASTLLEIKSRLVLLSGDEEEQEVEDPRDELVERLLEYKRYKDAASLLEEQSREWQQRYARLANDLPARDNDLGTQPIQEIELWDLVSALGRMIRDKQAAQPSNIVYDDTPLQVYMGRIHQRMQTEGRVSFSEMFEPGIHKSAMIGVFLAILELVRHHSVTTNQNDLHGEIWILPGDNFSAEVDFTEIDSCDPQALDTSELPAKPR
jgi:segregation and condensation protein A